jgi:transposase
VVEKAGKVDLLSILKAPDLMSSIQAKKIAAARSPALRIFYQYQIRTFQADQFVFIDESGTDRRIGFRKTAWSPLGVAPIQHQALSRGDRWQILPAYTLDGILAYDVYQGSTDSSAYETFLRSFVLPKCNPFPAKNSVLVMDNASFHHSERIREMCEEAGVKLVYLPPYSPDFNPIEEFFSELKAYIKRHWGVYANMTNRTHKDFAIYLRLCIDQVGNKKESTRGHFKHAGIDVDGLCLRLK